MKTFWGKRGIAPRLLNLGNSLRWVVSFTPWPLYPGGRTLGTHWVGDWVGPRAILEVGVRRKIPSSCRKWKPVNHPVVWSLYWLSYHGSLSSSCKLPCCYNHSNLWHYAPKAMFMLWFYVSWRHVAPQQRTHVKLLLWLIIHVRISRAGLKSPVEILIRCCTTSWRPFCLTVKTLPLSSLIKERVLMDTLWNDTLHLTRLAVRGSVKVQCKASNIYSECVDLTALFGECFTWGVLRFCQ
jgi:hypothetical protein